MHQETLKEIVGELDRLLTGRYLGRIFQLSNSSLALDFGVKDAGYLFISVEPAAPRLYLIKRSARELEKSSLSPSPFAKALRSTLSGGSLLSVKKDEAERIVRFSFSVADEVGGLEYRILVAQLTGRSANLFLLNSADEIIQAWREPKGEGQHPAEPYRPPALQAKIVGEATRVERGKHSTVSVAADEHYRRLEVEGAFEARAASLVSKLQKEITKRKQLRRNLQKDLVAHGNPQDHKRTGDLLLANITTAKRRGGRVTLKDYYAEGTPTIEIEIDENSSLQEAAGEAFLRYTKSKRALREIGQRLVQVDRDLAELEEKQVKLNQAIAGHDEKTLGEFDDRRVKPTSARRKQKASPTLRGMRRYRSSDGYEVIVGRTARDNDQLTFRVAGQNDLWLHAGDYPGSHVIVRNSSRSEIPHRTIIEAAQLAAKFSQASKDSKVTIHYTQRKFLSKPKGAAPGLVRMSSFKTVTVAPGENLERL